MTGGAERPLQAETSGIQTPWSAARGARRGGGGATVSRRRWLLVGAALLSVAAALLAGQYFVRDLVILPSFAALERAEVEGDVARAEDAIRREVYHLSQLVSDWAVWDDTYRFVASGDPSYVASNLQWASLEVATAVNLVVICGDDGRVLWGEAHDARRGGHLTLAGLPTPGWPCDNDIVHFDHLRDERSGLVATSAGPLLVSSRPIVTSAGEGPARGALVMGRFLDDELVAALRGQTQVDFSMTDVASLAADDQRRSLVAALLAAPAVVEQVGDDLALGHGLLRDLDGRPALLVTAEVSRDITARGRRVARMATAAILLVVCVSLALCSLMAMLAFGELAAPDQVGHRAVTRRLRDALLGVVVATVGVLVFVAAFIVTRGWEQDRVRASFVESVAGSAAVIEQRLHEVGSQVASVGRLFAASVEVSEDEFAAFVLPLLAEHAEIATVAWAAGSDENAVIRYVVGEGSFGWSRDDTLDGDPTVAAAVRRARTKPRGEVAAEVVAGGRGGRPILVVCVHTSPREGALAGGAGGARPGVVVAAASLAEVAAGGIPPALRDQALLSFVLPTKVGAEPVVAVLGSVPAAGGVATDAISTTTGVTLGDRAWELTWQSTRAFHEQHQTWLAPVVLAVGLVLTAWLTVYVVSSQRRTARVEAEVAARTETLAQSRRMLRKVLDTIPVRVFWKDRDSTYLGCNRHFAEDVGLTNLRDVKGRTDTDFADGDLARERRAEDLRILATAVPLNGVTLRVEDPQGRVFWRRLSKVPLQDENGAVVGILGTYEDITELKRHEIERIELERQLQQAQKIEAIGQLAGGIAHDFNNIVTGITGNASLALMNIDPAHPVVGNLTEINCISQRAADLTRQLLAFSRRQMIEPRVINLNGTLRELHKMLVRLIGEDVELCLELQPDLWNTKVDPGQVEQVIVNLCVNARDAMASGGRLTLLTANRQLDEVYCQAHSYVLPGPYVLLEVTDTGIGMEPELLARIYEPFFTTKPKGKGTGLGLATVYGAVKQNQGFIEVASTPGRGTTFQILFPRVEASVEATGATPSLGLPRGSETVLFVEDEQPVRMISAEILRRLGYRVLVAACGEEALTIAAEHGADVDILVTDVIMPGMTGRELADRLVATYPGLRVLYCSGYTADVIASRGVLQEGVAFVEKPFTPERLATRIRAILDAPAPGSGSG